MTSGREVFRVRNYAVPEFLLFGLMGVIAPYLQVMLRGLGYSSSAIGIYSGVFEVAGLAGSIYVAKRADALGQYHKALITSTLAICIGAIPLALFPNHLVTAISIIVMSMGMKTILPVMDAAFTNAGERRRLALGKGFDYGAVRAIGTAGFIAVAMLLQAWPGFSESRPIVIALCAALPATAFILSLRMMPRAATQSSGARRAAGGPAGGGAAAPGSAAPGSAAARRRFYLGLAVIALGRLAMSPYSAFFSLYLREELRWDAVGAMWSLAAFAEIPMMLAAGFILSKISPLQSVAISSVGVVFRLAVLALFPSPAGVVVAQLLHAVSYGLFQPASIAFVALGFPPHRRALGMTLFSSFGVGLPVFAGSIMGGFIAEAAGYRVLFAAFVPFALASIALYFIVRPQVEMEAAARSAR